MFMFVYVLIFNTLCFVMNGILLLEICFVNKKQTADLTDRQTTAGDPQSREKRSIAFVR